MGGICSTNRRDENWIQNFSPMTRIGETTSEA